MNGTNTEMDWSEWLRSQECFECCFGKKACVWRISVIGHLVEVESANILRRGRGKREARITRDGRRKYIYIWFFLCSNSKKKRCASSVGCSTGYSYSKRPRGERQLPNSSCLLSPLSSFKCESARVRVQRGIRALLHKPAGIDIFNP